MLGLVRLQSLHTHWVTDQSRYKGQGRLEAILASDFLKI